MFDPFPVIAVSVSLQLAAAALTLRLILVTGKRAEGTLILAAVSLMAFRRALSLYHVASGDPGKVDLLGECTGLVISFLLVFGILYVTRLIVSGREGARALAEKREFLQAVLDTGPECIKLLSRDGTVLMMNPAGVAMMEGGSFDDVRGKCIFPFVVPEHREAFRAMNDRVFRGESGTLEFEMTGLSGRRLWMETHAVPLRNDGPQIVASLAITRDVTEKRAMSAQKEELIARLTDALANVKTLKGLLPICASCKKIRDDTGYWNRIASYLSEHSEAELTHGLCPECARIYGPRTAG